MREAFVEKITEVFTSRSFQETTLNDENLYVYDDDTQKVTIMTSSFVEKSFHIENSNINRVTHICIDGDFIPFGQYDYVGDNQERGRNDFIAFNDGVLLFVELKLNVSEETTDKGKWKNFSKGMKQLEDFIKYFMENFPVYSFYDENNVKAIVCMSFYPSFEARKNTQRNGEINKFYEETGIRIIATTSFKLIA